MLLPVLGFIAVFLTLSMFVTRERMLGYPSGIFWALLGGYCFTQSTTAWDMYFLTGFTSLLGMTTFCAMAMYGLRDKQGSEKDWDKWDRTGARKQTNNNKTEETTSKKNAFVVDDADDYFSGGKRSKAIRERSRVRRNRLRNYKIEV